MKGVVEFLMTANAALFLWGAMQHVGLVLGPFWEPTIFSAAAVETLCAVSLLIGVAVLFKKSNSSWLKAIVANVVAIAGVILGMIALALGRGPRTASNDLYHRIMLTLAVVSILVLLVWRSRDKKTGTTETS
ncbi:MAG TPA: hypothetical protein VKW78_18750 [Terriglobales bacterium]|nr:hypothetical protein [Terriglobales bacterium]